MPALSADFIPMRFYILIRVLLIRMEECMRVCIASYRRMQCTLLTTFILRAPIHYVNVMDTYIVHVY